MPRKSGVRACRQAVAVAKMMIGLKQSSTRSLMKPANEDMRVSRPVSKAVGNVKNNGPELLA
jgi:putative SOS response-associated peptidase YedK